MQTFFLDTNLYRSALQLDTRRHSKQLVEAMQIYRACFDNGPRQGNPYAYKMWQNWPGFLIAYGVAHYIAWQHKLLSGIRGGKLTHKSGEEFFVLANQYPAIEPDWLTEAFCSNHRSIMLGKVQGTPLEKWYSQFDWVEKPAQQVKVDGKMRWPYLWP